MLTAKSQVGEEIRECLKFVKFVYDSLGFSFNLKLSTRPEKVRRGVGELLRSKVCGRCRAVGRSRGATNGDLGGAGTAMAKRCCGCFDACRELNAGDGAFYGPKIDVSVTDALTRVNCWVALTPQTVTSVRDHPIGLSASAAIQPQVQRVSHEVVNQVD